MENNLEFSGQEDTKHDHNAPCRDCLHEHGAQLRDLMELLQFLKILVFSAWINNPRMPLNEDFSQWAKQFLETSPRHQNRLDSMIFQVWENWSDSTLDPRLVHQDFEPLAVGILWGIFSLLLLLKDPEQNSWKMNLLKGKYLKNQSGKKREQILNMGMDREGNNSDESREEQMKAVGNFWC